MSRAKRVNITTDGLYCGDLSEGVIERIRKVRASKECPSFTHSIYNFDTKIRAEARALGLGAYEYALNEGTLDKYKGKLRDYQTVGAAFLFASPRSILGDAAGIGKTPQVCGMLNKMYSGGRQKDEIEHGVYANTKRVLVAAENSAVGQIAGEIEKFTGLRVAILHSTADKMTRQINKFHIMHELDGTPPTQKSVDFDVLVITHSTLRSDTFFNWFARVDDLFGTFILDESYVVKNPVTAVSEYVKVLCSKFPRVHFLNATVFETRLLEVVNQFNLIYPNLLPIKSHIEADFCCYRMATFPIRGGGGALGNKRELTGYKNQSLFKEALSLVYLTRKKKDVKISDTERSYLAYLMQPSRAQRSAISKGYRYFEILNCPSLCLDIDILNEPSHVPKLARLLDLVREDYDGQSVMIYAWHLDIQAAIKYYLEREGRKVAILNGETKDKDKDAIKDGFNDGTYDVLVTNRRRSLNLQAGDVCIFYSVETNPASIEQIAARIDRNVDDNAKTFVLLAYEGEEVDFFINTVRQRSVDGSDLTDVVSETVLKFGELLLEILDAA